MKSELEAAAFIRAQTIAAPLPFIPELMLYQATEVTPLWQLTEEQMQVGHLPPPFWAFAWAGGQGLARYLLDNPEVVRGKRVVDFASGSGLCGLAAMKAGAAKVMAVDIDPLALAAMQLNAELNNLPLTRLAGIDMEKVPVDIDLIITGDVCYQQAMATKMLRWLWLCVAAGVRVILGDPGRAYVPESGLKELARYTVPTNLDLEDQPTRLVKVWDVGLPVTE